MTYAELFRQVSQSGIYPTDAQPWTMRVHGIERVMFSMESTRFVSRDSYGRCIVPVMPHNPIEVISPAEVRP